MTGERSMTTGHSRIRGRVEKRKTGAATVKSELLHQGLGGVGGKRGLAPTEDERWVETVSEA